MVQTRVQKASCYLYKAIYYTMGTIWGYMIFKDSEMLPYLLGGPDKTGEILWIDSPFSKPIDGALMYSLITMGYNIEELIDHGFIKERWHDY